MTHAAVGDRQWVDPTSRRGHVGKPGAEAGSSDHAAPPVRCLGQNAVHQVHHLALTLAGSAGGLIEGCRLELFSWPASLLASEPVLLDRPAGDEAGAG